MLTIFAIPKPFVGHIGLIQRNALRSWTRLHPDVQIILCGDEPGVAKAADDFGVTWMGEVAKSELGTPLLDGVFLRASQMSQHEWLCYVNADIIVQSQMVEVVRQLRGQRCLAIARRWNVDIREAIDWDDSGSRLRFASLCQQGMLGEATALDLFLLPRRSMLTVLPPFAVGRPAWDNWLVWNARRLGFPVVDLTPRLHAIHQNHGYEHVPQATGPRWEGPEAHANRELRRTWQNLDLRDVTHELTEEGITPVPLTRRLRRKLGRAANRWLLWDELLRRASECRRCWKAKVGP